MSYTRRFEAQAEEANNIPPKAHETNDGIVHERILPAQQASPP